jgi:hypothetical protein
MPAIRALKKRSTGKSMTGLLSARRPGTPDV